MGMNDTKRRFLSPASRRFISCPFVYRFFFWWRTGCGRARDRGTPASEEMKRIEHGFLLTMELSVFRYIWFFIPPLLFHTTYLLPLKLPPGLFLVKRTTA
jgi:hypothetical protein